jgi:hypothetical protein
VYAVAAAGHDYATVAFACGLAAVAARRFRVAGGAERRARGSALAAAAALAAVLGVATLLRRAGNGAEQEVLVAYDVTVLLVAVGLFADLLWGRWGEAALTGMAR